MATARLSTLGGLVVQKLTELASSGQMKPHATGIILPLIETQMVAEREAEGPRPTATGSRLRASDAMRCAREIGFRILDVPETEAIPFETLMAFDVGQRFHERLQEIARDQLGAETEVVCDYGESYEMSGHADLKYDVMLFNPGSDDVPVTRIGEIKSMAGYGFLIAVGARKSDDGPGPKIEHVTQAAICANAPNIDAKQLHMIYVDKDKHSIAEWVLDMDTPIAKWEDMSPRELAIAELERQTGILGRIDAELLPARHIPGVGRVEHVPLPDSRDQPWQCRYCRYNSTCRELPSAPVPLAELNELLGADGPGPH